MTKPLYYSLNDAMLAQHPNEALKTVIKEWQEIVSNARIVSELTSFWLRTKSVEKQKIILSVLENLYPTVKFSTDKSSKIREELNLALKGNDPLSNLRSTISKLSEDGVTEEQLTFELTIIHTKHEDKTEKMEDALVDVLTDLVR